MATIRGINISGHYVVSIDAISHKHTHSKKLKGRTKS